MKKRKLKVLYILLTVTLAFLIALTGMFVPKLLLNTKAKKLATATGRMDNGDVSPYTYTMDTKTRIARVEKLVEQIFISGADMYINVRDPLDTELSCEPAQRTIKKFLIAYADMLEEYGLLSTVERNDTDAPVFGSGNDGNLQYQDRLTESGDAQLERDCTYIQMEPPDFMVLPENQQLSVWVDSGYIYDQFVEITIDAVTGLPVTVQFGIAGGIFYERSNDRCKEKTTLQDKKTKKKKTMYKSRSSHGSTVFSGSVCCAENSRSASGG